MSDQNKHFGIAKMTPVQQAGDQIGQEMADAAFLHDVGLPEMSPELLRGRWHTAYMLGRNGVEEALGSPTPYAAEEIKQLPPGDTTPRPSV